MMIDRVESMQIDLDELVALRQRVRGLEAKAEMDYAMLDVDDALICDLKDELAALKACRNAIAEFNEHWQEDDGNDPIERLRFFCSLAMRGQDWLDVEPFFDALKAGQGETVACWNGQYDHDGNAVEVNTSAPTIPEGWRRVMAGLCMYGYLYTVEGVIYPQGRHAELLREAEALLAAAPKEKTE